jgi:hypothetical protein
MSSNNNQANQSYHAQNHEKNDADEKQPRQFQRPFFKQRTALKDIRNKDDRCKPQENEQNSDEVDIHLHGLRRELGRNELSLLQEGHGRTSSRPETMDVRRLYMNRLLTHPSIHSPAFALLGYLFVHPPSSLEAVTCGMVWREQNV